jgi:tetratricopeptide (TPR) repeat protein
MRLGEYERALGLGQSAQTCLDETQHGNAHRFQLHALLGMLAFHRRAFESIEEHAKEAMKSNLIEVKLMGHILASRWNRLRGESESASQLLGDARHLTRTTSELLIVLIDQISWAEWAGKTEQLHSLHQELVATIHREADVRVLARARLASARVLDTLGDGEQSLNEFRKARTHFAEACMPLGDADACNGAGRVLAKLGRVDEAVEMLSEASQIYSSLNHPAEVFPMLTQGVIELESGRYLAARKTMQLALERVIASGRLDLIGPTHAVLVPCAAAAGDWEAFDGHLMQARSRLASGNVLDKDIAEPLTLAGKLARAQSQDDRARAVYDVARQQWLGLGESDQVEAIDEEVFLLGDG